MKYWSYSMNSYDERDDTVALGTVYIDDLDTLRNAINEIYKLPLSKNEKELTEGITLQIIIRKSIVK